ncbi:PH domain-containing protein DDB_G0275795 [Spodoptera frugiperda]|uniref:PH domain-containing protein DDB_G0275795 n=1 Tax=Spodoptera frugiperda TaxID=7108 RepID=A0A9R0DLB2_SPOFR|nr:PH domain-containing protein DDB_G0275795 [Spodoptera frugiperda]
MGASEIARDKQHLRILSINDTTGRCWAQTFNQTAEMSQRLDNKKWLWCLLALHVGSVWATARPVTVRTPPSNPSTIEAQAKFFQDFFSVQLSPYKIEFGHVCEDPNTWEQRYEKKDFKNHRDMGKVRWGDKKGGYGEHYWDLNHAGNADNIGDDGDDGSYREPHDIDHGSYRNSHDVDPYDEPSNSAPTYGEEEYDPERSSYEETGRAKRAHPKVERARKSERKHPKSYQTESAEESAPKKQNNRDNRERNNNNNNREQEAAETSHEEEFEDADDEEEEEEEVYEKPKPKRQHYRKKENDTKQKEKNQIVLVVSHKDDEEQQQNQFTPTSPPDHSSYLNQQQPDLTQYLPQPQQLPQQLPQYLPQPPQVPKQHLEPPHFVPYEGGAGVRQHHQPDVTAASTVPRLFLEPSTGHVVDRATGQAYVLQPIAPHNNYN